MNKAQKDNQKDKHESDMKKQISKLQRHRDTIWSYLNNPDIKDKQKLNDYKRRIEQVSPPGTQI